MEALCGHSGMAMPGCGRPTCGGSCPSWVVIFLAFTRRLLARRQTPGDRRWQGSGQTMGHGKAGRTCSRWKARDQGFSSTTFSPDGNMIGTMNAADVGGHRAAFGGRHRGRRSNAAEARKKMTPSSSRSNKTKPTLKIYEPIQILLSPLWATPAMRRTGIGP